MFHPLDFDEEHSRIRSVNEFCIHWGQSPFGINDSKSCANGVKLVRRVEWSNKEQEIYMVLVVIKIIKTNVIVVDWNCTTHE